MVNSLRIQPVCMLLGLVVLGVAGFVPTAKAQPAIARERQPAGGSTPASVLEGIGRDLGRDLLVAVRVPAKLRCPAPGEGSRELLDAVAAQMGAGWCLSGSNTIVLSERLRPRSVGDMARGGLKGNRALPAFAFVPALMGALGEESRRALTDGQPVLVRKGEPAWDLAAKTMALCQSPDQVAELGARARSYDVRGFACPAVVFYADPMRVPGLIILPDPRVHPQWHRWTGDPDKAPLFSTRKFIAGLDGSRQVSVTPGRFLSLAEIAATLQTATRKEWHFDARLEPLRLFTNRAEWPLRQFLEVLAVALHTGYRSVGPIAFAYATRYDAEMHRWADDQAVSLLQSLFTGVVNHGKFSPELRKLLRTPDQIQPRVSFAPFTKGDFVKGARLTWGQLTEGQRQFFRGILPAQWREWVSPAEVNETVVRCLPGVLFEIRQHGDPDGGLDPLSTCWGVVY